MAKHWIEIDVERILGVDEGRDTILIDRPTIVGPNGGKILIQVSEDAFSKLREHVNGI